MSAPLSQRIGAALLNHGGGGKFDFKIREESDTFRVDGRTMDAADFGNYIAGYAGIYFGGRVGLAGVLAGGIVYDAIKGFYGAGKFDLDADSVPDIYRGAFRANQEQRGKVSPAMCMCQSSR